MLFGLYALLIEHCFQILARHPFTYCGTSAGLWPGARLLRLRCWSRGTPAAIAWYAQQCRNLEEVRRISMPWPPHRHSFAACIKLLPLSLLRREQQRCSACSGDLAPPGADISMVRSAQARFCGATNAARLTCPQVDAAGCAFLSEADLAPLGTAALRRLDLSSCWRFEVR